MTNFYRTTDFYFKQGAQWQLVAHHYSSVPADKAVAKLDPKIYDAYIGQYELASDHFLTLTREGDKLMGQVTGAKTKFELLPETETTFFIQGQRDQVLFAKDDNGRVTHINHRLPDGQVVKEKKIK